MVLERHPKTGKFAREIPEGEAPDIEEDD